MEEEALGEAEEVRNQEEEEAICMSISRIAYDSYQEGFSRRMFEKQILKATLNGCDMGDYNNSHYFFDEFRKHVAEEVQKSVHFFLHNKTKQTGFLPPLNIQADKGTNVHQSRQFTTCAAVMPDSTDLIVNIYIGQPIVKNHTADGLASSIAEQILKNSIDPAQIESFSGDGQYIKWKVHDILKEKVMQIAPVVIEEYQDFGDQFPHGFQSITDVKKYSFPKF